MRGIRTSDWPAGWPERNSEAGSVLKSSLGVRRYNLFGELSTLSAPACLVF